nr:hypothetical protein [Tanacetum cinerariifolium]
KWIATESEEDPTKKLVHASTIIRLDPDEPDKEEKMKKAVKETKLLAMSRPEVIKVIHKEAKKLKIDLKEAISTKAGETFKKAQDADHEVLKREHYKKVKSLTELNKRKAKEYMNNDKRKFDVHNLFKFTDFGITELDGLGPIIQKKKKFVVKDLMISLSKRYDRLKKTLEELGIQYALPASVPEQVSSQTSGRKRKHMELEPEINVPRLECNRSLPEGVPFVNNMVIEEPKYEIFFTDVFGLIIQKKKNSIIKDLMTSLSKRYERLKKIYEELGIHYALPAPVPEQASSQTLGRKRKHMELEPEVKVPGLECNRSLLKGVPFVNNMVIEEPEYGIFFTDVFGD